MGNCISVCTSCCKGDTFSPPSTQNLTDAQSGESGRSKAGLYEPGLADNEREAVADLLQYLENVWSCGLVDIFMSRLLKSNKSVVIRISFQANLYEP